MSRNKRHTSAIQATAFITICTLFILTALVGLYKCFSEEPELTSGGGETQNAVPDASLEPTGDTKVKSLSNRKEHFHTVLLGGLDDENGGSDTNLLLAIDSDNGTMNVVSLPRDTLLNVSWSVKKLNNAYHHGGFSQTMEEVSKLLGIPVDHYVTVNLQAFVQLVDAIGGVDFEVPVNMNYDDDWQNLHIHFDAGFHHLSGQEALEVVRWRKNNDGTGYATADIGRIDTQQAFLKAVAKQTLQISNVDKVGEMAEIFETCVDTDLKLSNLIWIGEQALKIGPDKITFHTLPGDGAGFYKDVSYYVLEPEGVLELINTYFNPYLHELTLEDMDILVP